MRIPCSHIKAKGLPEETTLYEHLLQVSMVAEKIADHLNIDAQTAKYGAILHDIGKASPVFQERLKDMKKPNTPFRHEIASCFFLTLFDEKMHTPLIEMIIAHHKSVLNDSRDKGILDLEENREDTFELHIKDWESWKDNAMTILDALGIETRSIFVSSA